MDKKIHQVITKDIEPSEVIIDGQGEIRKNSDRLLISILDQSIDVLPRKNSNLDIRVVGNIRPVVKMKWDMEGIRVRHKGHTHNQPDRDEVTERGPLPLFLLRRGSLLLVRLLVFLLFRHVPSQTGVLGICQISIPFRSTKFQ